MLARSRDKERMKRLVSYLRLAGVGRALVAGVAGTSKSASVAVGHTLPAQPTRPSGAAKLEKNM